jgi:hypothetical protein
MGNMLTPRRFTENRNGLACLSRALLLFALLPFSAQAEIYKWTDASGRIHFGDKPRDTRVDAEEIEVDDYKPGSDEQTRNIIQRRQRLMNADADKKAADAAHEKTGNSRKEKLQKLCADARQGLLKISGRVEFHDDNGKRVHVSEQERAERQRELQVWIKDNCR